ncbi:5121_t:CDS:2 [Cetraspora pellucida]|uniref:5121_t:CDS:1 n=1 Tax=Cetraspora pellucida TaxID=1433469 RepID=A0A9N9HM83_9GLOM|nr:5121_t:CDS:2 [Cetraspora pellucida]
MNNLSANFRYIDDRRFHNVEDSKYLLPNDKQECDRLLLQHLMWKNCWNGNFSAPIEKILTQKGSKVLDVGFPKAHFTGVDFVPIQPNENKLENVTFVHINALEGLPFKDNTFDYIFQRFLVVSYPRDKWDFIISELVRVLKPGGYLELMEDDLEPGNMGPVTNKLATSILNEWESIGLDTKICYKLPKHLEQNKMLKNIWSEQRTIDSKTTNIGDMQTKNWIETALGLRLTLSNILNITHKEFDKSLDIVYKEFIEFNSFTLVKRAYAQKIEAKTRQSFINFSAIKKFFNYTEI